MRSLLLPALAVAALVATPGAGLAACGDANGDGRVTVSDGVQALRAAAGLSSACDRDCDVDGSGAVTVSDGVNILRKAAGLATDDQCPDDPVASLIGHTIGLFGPLTKSGAVGGAAAASPPCDNPEGSAQQTNAGVVYDDCDFGDVTFTGFLGISASELNFDQLTVRRRGDVVGFGGSLFVGQVDGNPALNGVLDADSQELGSYVVTFQQVVNDAQGNAIDGLLSFDTTDAAIPNVVEVRVTLTGGTSLPVVVRFADDTEAQFTYDTDTDDLTPVDAPTPTPTATPPAARVRLSNIDDRITAFLNGTQVLQAQSTGPNATQDTGFVTVSGLHCGDNVFEFRVENTGAGSGYAFRAQLQVGGTTVVDRTCGTAGVVGCDDGNQTLGEVARDVTFVCVPCGPCTAGAGTCAAPIEIPSSGRVQIHGRVAGASALATPCGGGGAESVFVFTPAAFGCYEFNTCGTAFDSQLSFGDGFCGSNGPLAENCLDDNQSCAGGGAHESTFSLLEAGQPVTLLLDSEAGQGGSYTFDVRPSGQCIF